MVLDNTGLYEVALDPFHTAVRSFFIDLHETAVASDIASDNRGKTARRRPVRGLIARPARLDIANFSHGSHRSPCTAKRRVGTQLTIHETVEACRRFLGGSHRKLRLFYRGR
jgi:hypothetical protein